MGRKAIDLTGQRFGRLVVLMRVENDKSGAVCWLCQCDCGNQKKVQSNSLRSGNTTSCGCRMRELNATRSITHKASYTRLYQIWGNMMQRCTNPNHPAYSNYGGRGIAVCDEWRNSFVAFRDWALAHGYEKHLSIDRIDVDGDYSPENCRWVTMKAQQSNRRNNHLLTAFGKTQALQQWANEYGIGYNTIRYRLACGWSVEDALTTPVKSRSKK